MLAYCTKALPRSGFPFPQRFRYFAACEAHKAQKLELGGIPWAHRRAFGLTALNDAGAFQLSGRRLIPACDFKKLTTLYLWTSSNISDLTPIAKLTISRPWG